MALGRAAAPRPRLVAEVLDARAFGSVAMARLRARRSARRPRVSLALLALALLPACGAKTGVDLPPDVPDLGTDMAFVPDGDAALDGGRPDDADLDLGADLGPPCVPLPILPDGGLTSVEVALEPRAGSADLLLLMDVTGTMRDGLDDLRAEVLDAILPPVRAALPGVRVGLATFADFPVADYGYELDVPYRTVQGFTTDAGALARALRGLVAEGGGDEPEALTEALYQAVTGAGVRQTLLIPPREFVPPASCPAGTFGHPCFRRFVPSLVVAFTDEPTHEGPDGSHPYDRDILDAPVSTYEQMIEAVTARGVKVFPVWAIAERTPAWLLRLARDTGTVDEAGRPLAFSIGPGFRDLSRALVDAVERAREGLPVDVDVVLTDPVADDLDALALVAAVVPVRAEPMGGIDGIDEARRRFLGVRASTRVVFRIDLRTDLVRPGPRPREVWLDVTFRGDGAYPLGTERLRFEIPGFDGYACADAGR
jgi:hypothetical protein